MALIPADDGGETGGTTGTPLDLIIDPLAAAAGDFGAIDPADPSTYPLIGMLIPADDGGETGGTTGTPLDIIIDPLASAFGGFAG